jgi:hypothetical protein
VSERERERERGVPHIMEVITLIPYNESCHRKYGMAKQLHISSPEIRNKNWKGEIGGH